MVSVHDPDREVAVGELVAFRQEFYECLTARADALFEVTDALLCSEGAVRSLPGLSLAPEHQRGHGALYDAMNHGRLDTDGLRGILLPRNAYRERRMVASCWRWMSRRGCVRTRPPRRGGRSAIPTAGAGISI